MSLLLFEKKCMEENVWNVKRPRNLGYVVLYFFHTTTATPAWVRAYRQLGGIGRPHDVSELAGAIALEFIDEEIESKKHRISDNCLFFLMHKWRYSSQNHAAKTILFYFTVLAFKPPV